MSYVVVHVDVVPTAGFGERACCGKLQFAADAVVKRAHCHWVRAQGNTYSKLQ
jgi:uncharacterized protein YfaT (DUF1175 family)